MSNPDMVIHGLPGTGKTTSLMEILVDELENIDNLSEVAGTTFRKNMAEEFKERAKANLEIEELPEYHNFRTTHAICYRLLDVQREEVVHTGDLKGFFSDQYSYSAEFDANPRRVDTDSLSWSDLQQKGNDLGNKLVRIYDWSRHIQEDIGDAWKSYPALELEDRRKLSPGMVMTFQEEYEDWKRDQGLKDFTDMLIETLARGKTPNVEVLIEDEFQDKSPLMKKVYELWRDDASRTYIAGDSFQCIPEGEEVNTPEGKVQIEEIEEGDEIYSGIGYGDVKNVKVSDTHTRMHDGEIVELITESGKKLRCTPEHELFSYIPTQKTATDWNFIYIMKSDDGHYRIGKTNMPKKRFNSEPGTSGLMIIDAVKNEDEAIIREKELSYKYGIPMDVFLSRENAGMHQELIDEIYRRVDSEKGFMKLCEDMDVSPDRWHLTAQSRGASNKENRSDSKAGSRRGARIVVNLRMNYRKDRGRAEHKLAINTSDEKTIKILGGMDEINKPRDAKGHGVRYRKSSVDYYKVRSIGKKVVETLRDAGVSATLDEKMSFCSREGKDRTRPLKILNAKQVMPGMPVPVYENGEVKYEEVKERNVYKEKTKVYDLTVPPMHNYPVNNIIVHNSLYQFMGGRPRVFEEEKEIADDVLVLDTSYRFGEELWDTATSILERHGYDVPEIEASGKTKVKRISHNSFKNLAKKHWKDDVAYLTRTNHIGREVAEELKQTGIPIWTSMGHRWTAKNVAAYNSVVKMRKGFPKNGEAKLDSIKLTLSEANRFVDMFPSREGEPFNMSKKAIRQELNEDEYPEGKADMMEYINMKDIAPVIMRDNPFVYMNKSAIDMDKLSNAWDLVGEEYIDRSRHVLTTIHGFKGDEADYVFLFNATSGIIEEQMRDREERKDEARVWFVGATRARKVLYVVDMPSQHKYKILGG